MKTQVQVSVLGAALLLSACAARLSFAQDHVPAASDSDRATAKDNSSSDTSAVSQANAPKKNSGETPFGLAGRFVNDQKQIWTSPARLRSSDSQWLVPFGGIMAGLFATDQDFSKHLSQNPKTISHFNKLSNAGVATLVGGGAGMWLLGHASHNEHWSETGFLAGEAALNSLVAVEELKYSLRRARPYQGDGSGPFFQSGGTSFPSAHSAAAWSVAGVIAHEYPGPLTKFMAYGLASLVDFSRIRARQHFPSDVFVGSMIGNFVAQDIYSRHHDFDLGGGEWRSIGQIIRGDGDRSPANQGSPYVPLDSWIYPAFDRLIARGYIRTAITGMRPWTRAECARLLSEADDLTQKADSQDQDQDVEAFRLSDSLTREFSSELALIGGGDNRNLQVESIYARSGGISGVPLKDGFIFGQTVLNDFGRPFAEGFNAVDGFSASASEGRLTAYVRGEFQYAPSSPALPLSTRQLIPSLEGQFPIPVPPNTPFPAVQQFQLLDTYVAINFNNWQASFGRQSLWWGPNAGGPIMFSDNAVPITMFRIDRVSPFRLPWILSLMGPIRWETFMGRLSGHEFVYGASTGVIGQWGQPLADQPFLVGQKLNFKPTPNFEFGVDVTTVSGGPGSPFTFRRYIQGMFSIRQAAVGQYGNSSDPGDRRSGVDFSYKVPKLRNWLTFYGDAFTEDEYSPLGYPRKSAYQGGLYLPQIPGLPKWDLRLEGGTTVAADFPGCVGCFYENGRFYNSYTNQGNLLGTWIGRASQGEQAWTTYWLTSRNKIQFNFRHRKIDGAFLPNGGTVNDASVKADVWLGKMTNLSAFVQFEKWNIPVLDPLARSNVASWLELSFWPRHLGSRAPQSAAGTP